MSNQQQETPPTWGYDPFGRYEERWWDGHRWTEHVTSNGVNDTDPLPDAQVPSDQSGANAGNSAVQSYPQQGGGGEVINPLSLSKVLLVERQDMRLSSTYDLYTEHGVIAGLVKEVSKSKAGKTARILLRVDEFGSHRIEIHDSAGATVVVGERPKGFLTPPMVISTSAGEIGRIVQVKEIGKASYSLEANGQQVGLLNAEDWRSRSLKVTDAQGSEIGRASKVYSNLADRFVWGNDSYMFSIDPQTPEPLRTLALTSVMIFDALREIRAR